MQARTLLIKTVTLKVKVKTLLQKQMLVMSCVMLCLVFVMSKVYHSTNFNSSLFCQVVVVQYRVLPSQQWNLQPAHHIIPQFHPVQIINYISMYNCCPCFSLFENNSKLQAYCKQDQQQPIGKESKMFKVVDPSFIIFLSSFSFQLFPNIFFKKIKCFLFIL